MKKKIKFESRGLKESEEIKGDLKHTSGERYEGFRLTWWEGREPKWFEKKNSNKWALAIGSYRQSNLLGLKFWHLLLCARNETWAKLRLMLVHKLIGLSRIQS